MKHLFMRMLFMLAVVAALGESTAHAELIDFSYQWTALPASVTSGTGNGSSVSITPQPKGTGEYDTVLGQKAFIPSLELTSNTSAPDGSPAVFPDPSKPAGSAKFQLVLSLTDAASHKTNTLTFAGSVSGSLSVNTSTVKTTFDSPLTQTLLLGSHLYSVTLDPFSNVGIPGTTAPGFIGASVSAASVTGGGPGPVTNTPEPSSLVLGGIALAGLAARRWSRLKQQAV
jgi:PEP-CTERM motif